MAKKVIISLYFILGVGIISLLIYSNIDSFIITTKRLSEVLKIDSLKNCFGVYISENQLIYDEAINIINTNINEFVETIFDSDITFEEILLNILELSLDISYNFIIYVCNYGLNGFLLIYLIFHETFNGIQYKIKVTKSGKLFILISNFITYIIRKIKQFIAYISAMILKYKRIIALHVLFILLANGILYRVIVELLIFVIVYLLKMINLETYVIVFEILQSLFIFLYPIIIKMPKVLLVLIFIFLIFFNAVSRAKYKLKLNHERLKKFSDEELTQTTFINGPPGVGKTLLNASLSLIMEERYIEQLEELLTNYEIKYKNINFAEVRNNPELYPEHAEYYHIYDYLYNRGTFITSNYPIYSPYNEEFSKIFDFDFMRVNKHNEVMALEEYNIISISELDKEYNSHDNKADVGSDGAATFFSTVSHNLKRHVKIFCDYQLRAQVPLRIRGNSEYFITIKKRVKKYPYLLKLYYLPIKWLYLLVIKCIEKYESIKRRITRRSLRKGRKEFKRNDINFIYSLLRHLAYGLYKVCNWFESFYFFKFTIHLSQEDEDVEPLKKTLCVNIRDLSHKNKPLYDSTFLSFAYASKKNYEFRNLDKFSSTTPDDEELDKCHSRFYDKIRY